MTTQAFSAESIVIKTTLGCLAVFGMSIAVPVEKHALMERFVREFASGMVNHHRHGLLQGPDTLLSPGKPTVFPAEYDNPEPGIGAAAQWRDTVDQEFTVIPMSSSKAIRDFFSRVGEGAALTEARYDKVERAWVFRARGRKGGLERLVSTPPVPKDILRSRIEEHCRQRLRLFQGRIELENTHTEWTHASADNAFISRVEVRFRRVFRGGMVLGNLSYVRLVVDGDGKLQEIGIKWPAFKPIGRKLGSISLDSASRAAVLAFQDTPPLVSTEDTLPRKTTGVLLKGAGLAWLPQYSTDGGCSITPVFSFEGTVNSTEGGFPHFLNVARLSYLELWEMNRKIRPPQGTVAGARYFRNPKNHDQAPKRREPLERGPVKRELPTTRPHQRISPDR